MKAPQKARQAHARKQNEGTLTQGVVVPFRTAAEKAQKFLGWKQQTQANADKQRLARARIAAEALPVSGGYSQRREDPGEPTPQRRAKGRPPLQAYSGKWPPEVEYAFARFVAESDILSNAEQRVTINYGGVGGGSLPSARQGGYGHRSDGLMTLRKRYLWVRHHLKRPDRFVLDGLVLAMPSERDGSFMTLEDFCRLLFPHIRDKAMQRGWGLGYIYRMGLELHSLYEEYDRDFGGR